MVLCSTDRAIVIRSHPDHIVFFIEKNQISFIQNFKVNLFTPDTPQSTNAEEISRQSMLFHN